MTEERCEESELVDLLPEYPQVLDETEEVEGLARDLWNVRDVTRVDVSYAGDGNTVWVHKDGFKASFSIVSEGNGVSLSEVGIATFEVDDERGHFLLEDVEVDVQPDERRRAGPRGRSQGTV